jgi:hypothetical protein
MAASGYKVYEAVDHWFGQYPLTENDTVTDLADGFLGRGDRRRLSRGLGRCPSPVPVLIGGVRCRRRSRCVRPTGSRRCSGGTLRLDRRPSGETGPDDLRDGWVSPRARCGPRWPSEIADHRAQAVRGRGRGRVSVRATRVVGHENGHAGAPAGGRVHLRSLVATVPTVHEDAFATDPARAPSLEERGGRHTVFEVVRRWSQRRSTRSTGRLPWIAWRALDHLSADGPDGDPACDLVAVSEDAARGAAARPFSASAELGRIAEDWLTRRATQPAGRPGKPPGRGHRRLRRRWRPSSTCD